MFHAKADTLSLVRLFTSGSAYWYHQIRLIFYDGHNRSKIFKCVKAQQHHETFLSSLVCFLWYRACYYNEYVNHVMSHVSWASLDAVLFRSDMSLLPFSMQWYTPQAQEHWAFFLVRLFASCVTLFPLNMKCSGFPDKSPLGIGLADMSPPDISLPLKLIFRQKPTCIDILDWSWKYGGFFFVFWLSDTVRQTLAIFYDVKNDTVANTAILYWC